MNCVAELRRVCLIKYRLPLSIGEDVEASKTSVDFMLLIRECGAKRVSAE